MLAAASTDLLRLRLRTGVDQVNDFSRGTNHSTFFAPMRRTVVVLPIILCFAVGFSTNELVIAPKKLGTRLTWVCAWHFLLRVRYSFRLVIARLLWYCCMGVSMERCFRSLAASRPMNPLQMTMTTSVEIVDMIAHFFGSGIKKKKISNAVWHSFWQRTILDVQCWTKKNVIASSATRSRCLIEPRVPNSFYF